MTIRNRYRGLFASCALALALSLLAACAGPPRWQWESPRKTAQERDADYSYCRKDAAQGISGPFTQPALGQDYWEEKEDIIRLCMWERGYEQEEIERE